MWQLKFAATGKPIDDHSQIDDWDASVSCNLESRLVLRSVETSLLLNEPTRLHSFSFLIRSPPPSNGRLFCYSQNEIGEPVHKKSH